MPVATEHQEQMALIQWAHTQRVAFPELRMLHAIANGGARHPAVAAKLKAEGVRPGVSDLFLAVAKKPYHGLYIELKRRQGGRLSEEQRAWLESARDYGYAAHVCRGWEEARDVLLKYMNGVFAGDTR